MKRAMKLFESFKISLKEEGLLSACYRVLKVISRAAERTGRLQPGSLRREDFGYVSQGLSAESSEL